jgi:hypothetical protein
MTGRYVSNELEHTRKQVGVDALTLVTVQFEGFKGLDCVTFLIMGTITTRFK